MEDRGHQVCRGFEQQPVDVRRRLRLEAEVQRVKRKRLLHNTTHARFNVKAS